MTIVMIVVLFFLACLFGLITIYLWYAAVRTSPAFEAKKRLRKLALEAAEIFPADLRIEILVTMTPLDKFLYKFKLIRKLDAFIDKAGLKIDVKLFLLIMFTTSIMFFFFGMLLQRGISLSILLMVLGALVPLVFLNIRRTKRTEQFTEQFPNGLDMISRSLKAGHSLVAALEMVGNEMSEPVAGLFKTAYEEQSLGLPLKDALANMVSRVGTPDLRFFVTSINIYRNIGGNLSEILEKLAHTIRERIKIRRQVRVYTAQARVSGYVLAALPIFVAVFFYIMAPDYIGELFKSQLGRYLVVAAIVAQISGFLVIRKIINIRI